MERWTPKVKNKNDMNRIKMCKSCKDKCKYYTRAHEGADVCFLWWEKQKECLGIIQWNCGHCKHSVSVFD